MNVAVKTLSQTRLPLRIFGQIFDQIFDLSQHYLVMILLSGLVLLSAFGVLYVKDYNRCLMSDVQTLDAQCGAAHNKASQLLLEASAWTSAAHVHQVAVKQLGMGMPPVQSIVLVSDM